MPKNKKVRCINLKVQLCSVLQLPPDGDNLGYRFGDFYTILFVHMPFSVVRGTFLQPV